MNDLKPCPFCGGSAEYDLNRFFINYKGARTSSLAIYCIRCPCDMTLCFDDYTHMGRDELFSTLKDQWNKRTP